MSRSRASLVVAGEVIVAATPKGLETAEAVGIAGGRVVAVGSRDDVLAAAESSARVIDTGPAAVIPGLHDFHIHLVGLARARAGVRLDDAADGEHVLESLRRAAADLATDAWLTGRGWNEAQLAGIRGGALDLAVGEHAAFLASHDGHSAWASRVALRLAAIDRSTPDPHGGRIERGTDGQPTGVLRETALDLVARHVPRLQGAALRGPLAATLGDLSALGITGACEAGDYTDEGGIGADAALGDSYSSLTDLADAVDGRLRLTIGIPVDAIPAATVRGLRTGRSLHGRRTLRFGWAKEYADGALGSGTAALFEPKTCGEPDRGILRVEPAELDSLVASARAAGIALAIHAIGDRAAAAVLDAIERGPGRGVGVPNDRIEHAQLVRSRDRERFAALGVTASIQPIHAAADRDLVEACWQGRQDDAYAWRSLADAGALLVAGSDAPVESVDPWLGMYAAIHRRLPTDARGDWRPDQAVDVVRALAAYTSGPATALGVPDEGHLRPGARADLAVLDIDRATLLAGGEAMASARSVLTLVDGVEAHRS